MPPPAACGEYAFGGISVIVRAGAGEADPDERLRVAVGRACRAGAPPALQRGEGRELGRRQAAVVAADDRGRVGAGHPRRHQAGLRHADDPGRVSLRVGGSRQRERARCRRGGGMTRISHRGSARRRGSRWVRRPALPSSVAEPGARNAALITATTTTDARRAALQHESTVRAKPPAVCSDSARGSGRNAGRLAGCSPSSGSRSSRSRSTSAPSCSRVAARRPASDAEAIGR